MARDHRRLAAIVSLDAEAPASAVSTPVQRPQSPTRRWRPGHAAAAVHYQLAQFELAAQMARRAITQLDSEGLRLAGVPD